MELKRETLVLKQEEIGNAIYLGTDRAPQQVDGKRGNYQRHVLANEKHGIFHVITPAMSDAIAYEEEVKVIEPLFYPDRGVNGRDVAPAYNVLGKKVEIVKGGK